MRPAELTSGWRIGALVGAFTTIDHSLDFLKAIIATPSPSGFEQPVAKLHRDYVEPFADKVTTDVMGNVSAVINPEASMRIMYAGHMDEIGFIVHYIHDDGFLFFNTIGAPTSPPRSDNGSGSMVASGCKGLSGAKPFRPSNRPTAAKRRR
ncbi:MULTISPECIES: hypothetical protein [unclassified Mesorhizobium]|uniref:hypothetical protein n=1 Tax=unclassified Mesorhizobium TaxID=325217 RepID=UPI0021E2C881|nr:MULTISPECIES: hypothetical protein [unclassified Mesorhizobium]